MGPSAPLRLLARLLHASRLIDRGYRYFDRLRARATLRFGTDAFFDAFNEISFGKQAVYDPSSPLFRAHLFPEELDALARFFPPPPATLLIGAAGGGREALALARRGYRVTTFDPAVSLVRSASAAARAAGLEVESLVGRYEDLPRLRDATDRQAVDLTGRRFDAAILGWSSYSNLKHDADRVEVLKRMAALTAGPLLVTYFPRPEGSADDTRRGQFAMGVGFFQELSSREVCGFAAQAGLIVRHAEDRANWPWVILVASS
jgi:hypothetical protein